jgi:hypothetical protein
MDESNRQFGGDTAGFSQKSPTMIGIARTGFLDSSALVGVGVAEMSW